MRGMRPRVTAWALLVTGVLLAPDGEAQCGAKRSTCSACHDGTRAALPRPAAWHENHAFADLCPTCHGGRGEENDLAQAHAGLVDPLGNEEACGSCHGESTRAFVERYRAAGSLDDAPRPPSSPMTRPHGEVGRNLAMTALVVAVGLLGGLFVVRHEGV
jgi:hypothetical protein